MNDLSLYLLDIANNSIKAKAKLIEISLKESQDEIIITINDNGKGMNDSEVKKILDPFYTTRITRKVGLGLPFFYDMIKQCDGRIKIESKENSGTKIIANVKARHIDFPPIGNMGETIYSLLLQEIDVIFQYQYLDHEYIFDSKVVKEILGIVSLTEYSVMVWIKDHINLGIKNILEAQK